MKTHRNTVFAAVGVVAVAASAMMIRARHGEPEVARAAEPTSTAVRVVTVASAAEPRYLEATGTTGAQMEANVATKVQGRVLSVLVREGDRVRRGQPLLRLDARDLDAAVAQAQAGVHVASVGLENARVAATMEEAMSQARVAQAQAAVANAEAAVQSSRARLEMVQSGPRRQERAQAGFAVAQAQSALTLAEKDLGRMKSLYADGAVSRQQLDIAQSRYDVAKAQYQSTAEGQSLAEEGSRQEDIRQAQEGVLQARAGLNQARAALRQARAASLQANVRRAEVRGAAAQVGQGQAALRMAAVTRDYATIAAPFDGVVARRMVDPGSLASPGVPLLTIQGGPLQLQAVVPESALPAVRAAARIPVMLDAKPGATIQGRVAEIAPQGDAQSHTFVVKINMPPSSARAGMFGRARLVTGRASRTLIPASAVTRREGLAYVFVADGGHARLRLVTTDDPTEGRVPVLSGLNPGEQVITDPASVSDGAAITVEG